MSKASTIREIFQFFTLRKKFHMFPILVLLIAMIGLTVLSQSGLITLIYPI